MDIDVGSIADFDEGVPRVLTVEDREFAVIRWGNDVYAVRNHCPHQGGPLCYGRVRARIIGGDAVGSIDVDEDNPVIVCPWHAWAFDVRSGQSTWSDKYRVRTYAAHVEGDRVLVDLQSRRGS